MSKTRLRLIVGNPEDMDIIVAGAIEESLYEIMDFEDADKLIARMKQSWAPDCLDWREILVDISTEDLFRTFCSPILLAEVVEKDA